MPASPRELQHSSFLGPAGVKGPMVLILGDSSGFLIYWSLVSGPLFIEAPYYIQQQSQRCRTLGSLLLGYAHGTDHMSYSQSSLWIVGPMF